MKLIIQIQNNNFYAYRESEKHYNIIENKLEKDGGRKDIEKLDPRELDEECNLENYNGYFVFDVVK